MVTPNSIQYKSVAVTHRGGPEALQVVENNLRPPGAGEAMIRIMATPVVQDDIAARIGNRPFLPRIPFVPGYSILGEVEATGSGVTDIAVGNRVAALTNFGGYAEYIYWPADQLVQVPVSLDPAEAVILILNYLVAYQILHRVAQVKAGDKALIIGSSGGVGTAFLQLGRLADLKMYGLASPSKHDVLTKHGAIPIDYHTQDYVEVIHNAESDGLDFVFNGMGEKKIRDALKVIRRGGTLVHYGGPESFSSFLLLLARLILHGLLPNGKSVKGYGTHRGDINQFKEDWKELFRLLTEGRIKPLIAESFPILEAARANELLESGEVAGNIVLLAPELL